MIPPPLDAAFRWSDESWGLALRCRRLDPIAQHAFTTRQLQLRTEDGAWPLAAATVGADADRLVRVKQVHGRVVRVVRRGERAMAAQKPEADAIVSNDPGAVLVVQVADCVPLLMADPVTGACAAVHAGWRGTCQGIAVAAVETMAKEFGSRPQDLVAAIGPSIGLCCYRVGEELVSAFAAAGAPPERMAQWFSRTDGLRLDLWTANTDQLRDAGVPADRIHVARLCTQTHADILESYRVDGPRAGRMAGLIRVP